jgi:UDP-N-acetylmuramyl pentapeptide phosphotransferase/UDP-N-acetylglucosamine-1-phosphate transferase
MLLLVYPIFETLFSMYRRKVIQGQSPGQPDRSHLHQLIYMRLVRRFPSDAQDPELVTRRNSMVAAYVWGISACFVLPALIFWRETPWLAAASLLFCAGYMLLYRWLLRGGAGNPV